MAQKPSPPVPVHLATSRQTAILLLSIVTIAVAGCGLRHVSLAESQETELVEPSLASPSASSQEALDFFETEVRPVLATNCFPCHGPAKQESGLRLDAREHVVKGGDSGPVVVPGDPDQSKLIMAVRNDGDFQMPPDGKLSDAAIDALVAWIEMGAPWPTTTTRPITEISSEAIAEARRSHWAFQPVREPKLPTVHNETWPTSPIDHFVLAKLEASAILPSEAADRATLIRRATIDLTGLPPTSQEVEDFINDPYPEAFDHVVDRLLASPRFGERWGRYWLDVARYADTKGYVYDGEERRYPYSYTYRDYVVRAFNTDLRYDQFLIEQIAVDRLPESEDRGRLAAAGFLTLGRRFVNNMHDVIDDRLDVIFRGTQGLTVTCARCHDHKFDPIPTRDYYSLYGVMAGSIEKPVSLVAEVASSPEYDAYVRELKLRESSRDRLLEIKRKELSDRLRGKVTDYLLAVLEVEKQPGDDFYVILGPDDMNPVIVRRWESYLLHTRRGFHPVFGLWHALAAIPESQFATQAAELIKNLKSTSNPAKQVNPVLAQSFAKRPPRSMRDVALRYGEVFAEVHRAFQKDLKAAWLKDAPAPQSFADPAREQLRQVLYGPEAPTTVPPVRINEIATFFDEKTRGELNMSQAKVDQLYLESSSVPPRALILDDAPIQRNPHVFIQGNPKLKGDEVPRQFLEVLAGKDRQPFGKGSGRRELAQAIASKDNPLTARVMVNRIWLHLFGSGLVQTPSNFGLGGEPPSHPELLDYLAWRFMQDDWSVKGVLRLIMLSSTYQQNTDHKSEQARKDPENRLLWRMNRRRMDFEAMRDSLLAVSGRLDVTMGGKPVSLTDAPFSSRRTVYAFIDRQNLPGIFHIFDFANPDHHIPFRHSTTVPQQALFMMNSPFVVEQAKALVARPEVALESDPAARIAALYQIVFQRFPTSRQLELGTRFIKKSSKSIEAENYDGTTETLSGWQRFAQALLLSNEFVFID